MVIDKTLKEQFTEYCEKNWNAKIYKANIKKNNEKWFYIQAGNYFKDCFHIEYIELDKKNKASISCRIFKR